MILGFLPLSKGSRACGKSATACGSLSGDEGSSRSYPLATRCVTRFIDVTGLHPSSIRCLLHARGVVVVLGMSIGRIDWWTGRIGGRDGDDRVCAGSSLV